MDYEPKTRKEQKGRDKQRDNVYSKKHVRQLETLIEKRAKMTEKKH